jgi:uncharacterized delta-60 repeat protein
VRIARSIALLGVSTALLFVGATRAVAAAGALDPTFGDGGKVRTNLGGKDHDKAVAIDSHGRIVTAGTTWDGDDYDFALARYMPSGNLDAAFGTGGLVKSDYAGGSFDYARAAAIDSRDRIVVAGTVHAGGSYRFAAARYKPNGSLDDSFGMDGWATAPFLSRYVHANAVAVDSHDRVVVAGTIFNDSTAENFAIVRFTSAGDPDRSFGMGGRVTTDLASGSSEYANGVAIDSLGRIVAAGDVTYDAIQYEFGVARYMTNGTRDASFGSPSFSVFGNAGAVAIDGRNRIVVAGYFIDIDSGDATFKLARYQRDGSLDGSFGQGGQVETDFPGGIDFANAVAIDSAGRIVAAGASGDYFAVSRYRPNGSLDPSFGASGLVTTDFGGPKDEATSVAIDSLDRIVAAGESKGDFALARYRG